MSIDIYTSIDSVITIVKTDVQLYNKALIRCYNKKNLTFEKINLELSGTEYQEWDTDIFLMEWVVRQICGEGVSIVKYVHN